MKTIEISNEVFDYLNARAIGFEMNTPDKVLRKLLNIKATEPEVAFDFDYAKPIETNSEKPKVLLTWKGVDFWEGMQMRFKGRPKEIALVKDGAIHYANQKFSSPSAAAVAANSGTSTNGWIHWEFFDTKTKEWKLIDTLRGTGKFKDTFIHQGLDRFHCRLIFTDGGERSGNLAKHFFEKEPDNYYLVVSGNMREFAEQRTKYEQTKDVAAYAKMKSLAVPVDLDTLVFAQQIN